ncbi:hypothetical protein PR048_009030 [Dryococelus australis]|uniref:Leucine-rich repeat-containing protein 23 n=1 Tax=Dryococelus australis TaxID=614101 RepID=A0ABQ9HYR8_9NEOP|nr:hypothetical protein PR048_009030 [Dryococelus australis]
MADEEITELEEEEEGKEYEEEGQAGDDEERESLAPRYEEDVVLEEEPKEQVMTLEQAQSSLSLLGRTVSGLQHAYLMANLSDLRLTDISLLPTFRHLLFVNVSGNLLSDDHIQVSNFTELSALDHAPRSTCTL